MELWEWVLLGVLLCIPAGVAGTVLLQRRRERQWLALATELGFQAASEPRKRRWDPGFPPLRGRIGAFAAQVRTYTTGNGDHEQRWTVLELALPDADPILTLRVTREGLGQKLLKALGGQDIELGDPELDRLLRVCGSDEARVRRALDPLAMHQLAALRPAGILQMEPALPQPDGGLVPARAPAMLANVLGLPGVGRAGEELRGLLGELGRVEAVAVLAFVQPGLRTDAAAVREALQLLSRLAASVTSAAPRPEPLSKPAP